MIRLPDGRTYQIQDLLRRVTRGAVINLRTGRINRGGRPANLKYSLAEREWQAEATIAEIQQRYGLQETQARNIQWKARQILAMPGVPFPVTEKDSKLGPT